MYCAKAAQSSDQVKGKQIFSWKQKRDLRGEKFRYAGLQRMRRPVDHRYSPKHCSSSPRRAMTDIWKISMQAVLAPGTTSAVDKTVRLKI